MTLGLLLLAAALCLTLYNFWDSNRAGEAAQTAVEALQQELPPVLYAAEDRDSAEIIPTEPEAVPEMAVELADGYDYIGILRVPCYDLTLPVMAGWNYNRLQIAPCVYSGSYYTDDLVICGHNYPTHFSLLKGISLGDEIILTAMDGYVYRYVVDNVETVQPTQIDRMIYGDDWDLTLFTCHTGGTTRCAIRCVRYFEE